MATGGLYGNSPNGTLIAQPGAETPGLYGKSPNGSTVAATGAETLGLYGNTVNFGGTFFEWFIFKEAATQPTTPTGGSWDFTTNTGSPPSGWTLSPPTAPVYQIWVSIAYVNSKTPTVFTWSTPGLLGVVASTNVGTTTTGAPGTNASVNNSGTSVNAVLNFTIPRGDVGATGPQGPQGNTGTAATIAAGTTTTGSPGTSASVTNSGTSSAAVFNFTIPRGDVGATGATGATGTAATIAVGTTTTTAPGTNATVTNTGTSAAAVFNFGIPKGAGVIAGGTAGQYLSKASGTDYDTVWSTITGTLAYQGAWNASTNSPTLTSSVGTNGYYYVVSVAGSTNLNGVTDWQIGDWAIFNGSIWQKLDQTNLVTSVAGRTGAVVLANTDISGLGTMSTQNANSVAITGGTESGVTHSGDIIGTYLDHTGTTAPAYTEGRTWYDSTSHALAYYNDVSSSIVHIGQDLQLKVINNTGSTIANGSPVYVTSTSSGQTYPNVALAKADVASTASVIGLTNGSIANGAVGYVTAQGGIDNVNTGTFTVGQVLYLSPYSAGQLMNTIPPTGITVQVGVVSYVNSSTGKIYVKQTTPLNVPASIISGQVALANGGTSANLTATAGGVVYSGASAMAISAAGTSGQVLTSSGTGAPTWTTPTTGTVTSVTGTSPVVSSGGSTPAISLAASYGDTQNPYASKTANYVLAAPNGASGVPTFRAIVAADIPTLNQNTTGTASNITATSNSTLTTLSALSLPYSQLSGTVPTWNQNTTGTASNVTGTVAITNGGTGQTTASAAFNSLSPVTSTGDLIVGNGVNSSTRLGIGTNGYVLTSNGTTATWAASTGGVTSFSAGSTGLTPSTATTGAVSLAGTLAIGYGGTGQTTANSAFNALAPSQTSNSGKYLTTDGSNTSWASVVSGASISNDTSTASNLYPLFAAATSGTPTTVYTSNAKYLYKPSTGDLSATAHVSSNGITINADSVSSSYTIATGTNGFSVGPLTINSGVTLTVASGQRHVII
jgi:hypothetical protein